MQVSDPTTPTRADFHITARVLAILAAVARYGVLSSEQIARIDGGSRQKVTRFLQRLVELKLLRRLDRGPEVFLGSFFDARPRVFGITPKALRLLAGAGMPLNVSPKKANITLAHELECAEGMFEIVAAVAAHGAVRLIDQPELSAHFPAATHALPKPLRLQAEAHPRDYPHLSDILPKPITFGIEPDRLFALALPDNSGWAFALELDRGTENILAHRIKGRATILRKIVGYTSAWSAGMHVAQWGAMCKALRVLVVTTSDTRITNMLAVQQHVGAPPGLFLYTTRDRLTHFGALGPAWVSPKCDRISLLERA